MEKIIDFITKKKIFNLKQIAENFNLKKNSICAYTKILRQCKIIKSVTDIAKILENFHTENGIYVILNEHKRKDIFVNLEKHFECNNYTELSTSLGIPPTTMNRWVLGYNGIPIKQLKRFYKILNWELHTKDVRNLKFSKKNRFYEICSTSIISPSGSTSSKA